MMKRIKEIGICFMLALIVIIQTFPVWAESWRETSGFTAEAASPSNAELADLHEVDWQVRFVDLDTHQIQLAETRKGMSSDGAELTVNFQTRIVDRQGRVWESLEDSPQVITVYGPGRQIYYIEYEQTGSLPEEEDPFAGEREKLEGWLNEAKHCEREITGEAMEDIPDMRFLVHDRAENNRRLITLAGQIADNQEHPVYVIGKNMTPSGIILKEIYQAEMEYSNLTEDTIQIEDDTYTVARFSLTRNYEEDSCQHRWNILSEANAGCLEKGMIRYRCEKCGTEEKIITAALGHVDENRDSVCDRCNTRAFAQELGSLIQANISISGSELRTLTFKCIDEDYHDGMLYLCQEEIPLEDFGGYGPLVYAQSNPARYFELGWQNAFSIRGNPLMTLSVDGRSGYAAVLGRDDVLTYRSEISGAYLTRTNTGSQLVAVLDNGTEEEIDPLGSPYGIRPVILLKKPEITEAQPVHWKLGDIQARDIDGEIYLFRCIDQNYSDKTDMHRQAALFLCDTVISANYGSEYVYEELSDGTYDYVFHPGPIVNFGEENDYKYSNIRKWLKEEGDQIDQTESINIGVSYAYMGKTEDGRYRQLTESLLSPSYIGNQKLTDKLFILSVDEALKYKDILWRFGGSKVDNPETQISAFSKGYWLRNPMGTSSAYDTDLIYTVDLVNGTIRPQSIKPESGDGTDEELEVTSSIGVRPAFVILQN